MRYKYELLLSKSVFKKTAWDNVFFDCRDNKIQYLENFRDLSSNKENRAFKKEYSRIISTYMVGKPVAEKRRGYKGKKEHIKLLPNKFQMPPQICKNYHNLNPLDKIKALLKNGVDNNGVVDSIRAIIQDNNLKI